MNNVKDKPEGYVFGRPTKYKPEYCQQLIDWMKAGNSFWTFASTIPCTIDTISRWSMEHKDFSEAKKIGRVHEQKWWDDLHRRAAATGEGNPTMIVWAQKNKFPKYYKERLGKQQSDVNIKQTLAMTGDFKSLVATMTPEQVYNLIRAAEDYVKVIEEKHGNSAEETK